MHTMVRTKGGGSRTWANPSLQLAHCNFPPPTVLGIAWKLIHGQTSHRWACGIQVNGSSIRPWWIHHHYWSIITCMILLTLPVDSPAVQVCVKKYLWWSAFQGSLMLMQNRYSTGLNLPAPVLCQWHHAIVYVSAGTSFANQSSGWHHAAGTLLYLAPILPDDGCCTLYV